MNNPVEEYQQSKEAARTARKEHEISLWTTWKNSGEKPEHLEPLLKLYAPIIGSKVRAWRPPAVPESAFRAELQAHAIKAFQSFDPIRGVALNTHVEARLPKVLRYGNRYANAAYIPEGQSQFIGRINRAKDELSESLGRDPTHEEIADHLGLTPKRVSTIIGAQHADIPMGRSGGQEEYDYTAGVRAPEHSFEEQQIAVAKNILPQIFPGQPAFHKLFNYTFGTNDHPQIYSTGELAKKMGKSQSQISHMKTRMGLVLQQHMGIEGKSGSDNDEKKK